MVRSLKYLGWIGVVCSCMLNSCTPEAQIKQEILHIEGVTWACNVSTSYSLFGSASESEEQPEVRIPASDGDLLYMLNEDDKGIYHRFDTREGSHLVVSYDTLNPHLIFINGKLSQAELSDPSLFEELEEESLNDSTAKLATLFIGDSLTVEMIRKLENLKIDLDGTGIYFECDVTAGPFSELISLCKPVWLAAENIPVDPASDQEMALDHLELLWISGKVLDFLKIEQCCNNLETLIVAEWDPGTVEVLPLSGLNKCHTLTLTECANQDLSAIEFPPNLKRLHLVGCDTLTDISGISAMPHLKSLGLAGSNDVVSLEPVRELTALRRIAFPANTSQEDFAAIIDRLQFLEVVELLDCPDVTDLSPLKQKENLKILVLQLAGNWPDNLGSLNRLELIILSKEIFDESPERIAELRQQLPDTMIVPGSGLCMGSGWLLLILPMIIASRFFFRRK
jgi:hypothetical protein